MRRPPEQGASAGRTAYRPGTDERENAVKVVIRVRPMAEREMTAGLQRVVSLDDVKTISVVDPVAFAAALALERDSNEHVESNMWAKRFCFDRCFDADGRERDNPRARQAQQEQIFEDIGAAIVDQAFSGFNATVFAYGQTGSGKSYTMMGSGRALDESVPMGDYGLIPRICAELFQRIDEVRHGPPGANGSESETYFRRSDPATKAAQIHGKEGAAGEDTRPFWYGRDDGPYRHHLKPRRPESAPSCCSAGATAKAPSVASNTPETTTRCSYSVEVSYLEIYNETLRDLFNPSPTAAAAAAAAAAGDGSMSGNTDHGSAGFCWGGVAGGSSRGGSNLRLREDPNCGVYVEGLTAVAVSRWEEMLDLIAYGGSARTVAATNANDCSSRSHAIFTLAFRQVSGEHATGVVCPDSWEACSSVNLVDLAGSERVAHTGASGLRLQEAGSINRSLAALSNVIKALSKEAQRSRTKTSPESPKSSRGRPRLAAMDGSGKNARGREGGGVFVPYRNSILTQLLRESLGGNSKTVMLACVSPCDAHYEETLGTLRYAERAKRVRTTVTARNSQGGAGGVSGLEGEGEDLGQAMLIQRLVAQVQDLRQQLAAATASTRSLPPPTLSTPKWNAGEAVELTPRGVVFVIDPALEAEIERLREAVVARERVIEDISLQQSPEPISTVCCTTGGHGRRHHRTGGDERVQQRSKAFIKDPLHPTTALFPPSSNVDTSPDDDDSSSDILFSSLTPPRDCCCESREASPEKSKQGGGDTTAAVGIPMAHQGAHGDCRNMAGTGMRLLNLNQDPMFSECVAFHIEEGVTLVGSARGADIRLYGREILSHHAIIVLLPQDGFATLTPVPGAIVHVNGVLVSAGERVIGESRVAGEGCASPLSRGRIVLTRDCRIVFGRRHFFRLNFISQENSRFCEEIHDDDNVAAADRPLIDWTFAQEELTSHSGSCSSSSKSKPPTVHRPSRSRFDQPGFPRTANNVATSASGVRAQEGKTPRSSKSAKSGKIRKKAVKGTSVEAIATLRDERDSGSGENGLEGDGLVDGSDVQPRLQCNQEGRRSRQPRSSPVFLVGDASAPVDEGALVAPSHESPFVAARAWVESISASALPVAELSSATPPVGLFDKEDLFDEADSVAAAAAAVATAEKNPSLPISQQDSGGGPFPALPLFAEHYLSNTMKQEESNMGPTKEETTPALTAASSTPTRTVVPEVDSPEVESPAGSSLVLILRTQSEGDDDKRTLATESSLLDGRGRGQVMQKSIVGDGAGANLEKRFSHVSSYPHADLLSTVAQTSQDPRQGSGTACVTASKRNSTANPGLGRDSGECGRAEAGAPEDSSDATSASTSPPPRSFSEGWTLTKTSEDGTKHIIGPAVNSAKGCPKEENKSLVPHPSKGRSVSVASTVAGAEGKESSSELDVPWGGEETPVHGHECYAIKSDGQAGGFGNNSAGHIFTECAPGDSQHPAVSLWTPAAKKDEGRALVVRGDEGYSQHRPVDDENGAYDGASPLSRPSSLSTLAIQEKESSNETSSPNQHPPPVGVIEMGHPTVGEGDNAEDKRLVDTAPQVWTQDQGMKEMGKRRETVSMQHEELLKAREACKRAGVELSRSQNGRDHLQIALQAVREQAGEYRRRNRREKKQLGKTKTLAESRARALEEDRDRLKTMLSQRDDEVVALRLELQKAQAATAAALACAAAKDRRRRRSRALHNTPTTFPTSTHATLEEREARRGPPKGVPEILSEGGIDRDGAVSEMQPDADSEKTSLRPANLPHGSPQRRRHQERGEAIAASTYCHGEGLETGEGGNPCTAGRVRQEGSPQQEIIEKRTKLGSETRRRERRHMVKRKYAIGTVKERDLDIGNNGSGVEERKQRPCQSTSSSAGRKAGWRATKTGRHDVFVVLGESTTSAPTAKLSGRGDGEYQCTSFPYAGGNLCRGSIDNVFGSTAKPRVPHSSRYPTLSYFEDFSSSRCTGSGTCVEECESGGTAKAMGVAPEEGREGLHVRRSTVERLEGPDEGSGSEEEEIRLRSQRRRQRDKATEKFLRKSRADLAAARRLLDRSPSLSRSGTTEISDVIGGVDGVLGSHEEQPPLDKRLEAAATGRYPAVQENNHVGRRAVTTEVFGDHQSFREQPKHREGFFYRASLTSRVAFITGTASPSPLGLEDEGGVRPEGECVVEAGVGAASRGLREDVADVRKRLEDLQSKLYGKPVAGSPSNSL